MLPETGELNHQQRVGIVRALEAFMAEHGLTQADVAKGIGQSATYVNNLINDAGTLPPATRDQMLRDINNWMDREARARDNRRPDDFTVTRPAERMIALAERLTERADMAVAYGPAGIGKTTTIDAIVAEIPTAVKVTADRDSRYPTGLLTKIWNALSRKKRKRPPRLADVVEKLFKPARIATHNILIVDQAHKLTDAAIDMLCDLHDQAKCSILLVGTVDLKTRVASDDDHEFGQVSSRVGMRVNLAPELVEPLAGGTRATACFTVGDIRKLFHRSKVKLHPDAARLLAQIANEHRGTLRRVERIFSWAETAARRVHSDTILVKHVQTAQSLVEEDVTLAAETGAAAVIEVEAAG